MQLHCVKTWPELMHQLSKEVQLCVCMCDDIFVHFFSHWSLFHFSIHRYTHFWLDSLWHFFFRGIENLWDDSIGMWCSKSGHERHICCCCCSKKNLAFFYPDALSFSLRRNVITIIMVKWNQNSLYELRKCM